MSTTISIIMKILATIFVMQYNVALHGVFGKSVLTKREYRRNAYEEVRTKENIEEPNPAADALYEFAFNLARNMNRSDINYAFAPVSIYGTLSALEPALRGRSRSQVREVLGLTSSNSDEQVTKMLNRVYNSSQEKSSFRTFRAQKLYVDTSLHLTKSYKQYVRKNPSLDLKKVDFFGRPLHSMRKINKFVRRRTQGAIPRLLTEEIITSNTKLFLAEGFSLETNWMSEFNPALTRNMPFVLPGLKTINVPTMRSSVQSCSIKHLSEQFQDTAFLVLPFKDSKLTMTIVMPSTPGNFAPLDRAGAGTVIQEALKELPREANGAIQFNKCSVHMPKFEINSAMDDLTLVLKKLGIVDLFSPETADFSGLVKNYHAGLLSIEQVMHQAKVTVDEFGLKISSATGASAGMRASNPVFINRPFIFMVRHELTGAVLLYGKVVDPSV